MSLPTAALSGKEAFTLVSARIKKPHDASDGIMGQDKNKNPSTNMPNSTSSVAKFPKKAVSKPLDKLTKYELIVLAQKQERALKRADKRISQLTQDINKTILDADRDFERVIADLEQAKRERKAFEVSQIKEHNTLLSLLAHAQMELQIAQIRNAILRREYGVTCSPTDELKTLRVGRSTVAMGFLYHEQVKN